MIINSSFKKYTLHVENSYDFLDRLVAKPAVFFVIDSVLYDIYKGDIFKNIPTDKLILLEATESNKNIETALEICEKLTILPEKRNINLVSIGGGIVQDITGFVANILYRGINWIFVPTTLLAACDSCIGGKTSLNYKSFKNLLGTFFPPDEIYICSQIFKTLSSKDFNSGLGEVVKFNVMTGEAGIENLEKSIGLLLNRNQTEIDKFLLSSLNFKKRFIEEDEFDKGIRVHLNFAHTFGHAFESISDYAIPHGTAVAMGMLVANRISLSRGILSQQKVNRIEALCQQIIDIDLSDINFDMDKILLAIRKDKKQVSDSFTAVLLNADFQTFVTSDVTRDEIVSSVSYVVELLKKGK